MEVELENNPGGDICDSNTLESELLAISDAKLSNVYLINWLINS